MKNNAASFQKVDDMTCRVRCGAFATIEQAPFLSTSDFYFSTESSQIADDDSDCNVGTMTVIAMLVGEYVWIEISPS